MIQTLEAIVDKTGKVSLLTEVRLNENRRALVTILEEEPKMSEKNSTQENLRGVFEKMRQTNMFRKIQNPTEWQKELRNEWE